MTAIGLLFVCLAICTKRANSYGLVSKSMNIN